MPSPAAHLGSGGKVAVYGFTPALGTGVACFFVGAAAFGAGSEEGIGVGGGDVRLFLRGRGERLFFSLVRFLGGPSPLGFL